MKLGEGKAGAMNATIVGSNNKESIILAHGYGGDQSLWEGILPSLARHFRVLVFDWGFSGAVEDPKPASFDECADDLIDVVDELDFGQSVLVGHSMSGMVGCIASIKRPELFKRLILLGASPRYINSDDYEGGLEVSAVQHIISSIESNFPEWVSTFVPRVIDPNIPQAMHKFERSLKRMRPQVALSLAKTIFYGDYRDILEKVLVPCTIMQTTDDGVAPLSVAHYMQRKIKGEATVEIIDTTGHFPHLTAPEKLVAVLGKTLGF